MSQKRPRAVFESDSLVTYGTPLPPLDPEIRDDGTYVPVWKQEAVDERGRKRFHGAFTGGFSAGYFNTVGSKEGWTPATFVSSRTKRAKDKKENAQQRAEDFMDEEDLATQEEAKQLHTNDSFSGIGTTNDDAQRRGALVDLVRPRVSIGIQLLEKMGWKQGQGIGPKVRRKARQDDGQFGPGDVKDHLFAPEDSEVISFHVKNDRRGLGLGLEQTSNQSTLPGGNARDGPDEDNDHMLLSNSRSRTEKISKPKKKSAFGVGVLNDNGSDDEDPYDIGPKISYNRSIGATKKPKKPTKPGGLIASSANPLLATKPVFLSKKKLVTSTGFRKCHDGRLPLEGFVLSTLPFNIPAALYAPPKIPPGWVSAKSPENGSESRDEPYQSTAEAARASRLNPASRAALIGESPLPGKSIFDFLTADARDRLVSATGKSNLPMARGEELPMEYRKSNEEKQTQAWKLVPNLDASLAKSALQRAESGGFMPYADDEHKRARYRHFLEVQAGINSELPRRAKAASTDEWIAEMREFAQAAQVFRPMTGLMASRFTSSASSNNTGQSPIAQAKPEDPAEQAAKMRMYGPLTRSVHTWVPNKLLCKRFGVRPPVNEEESFNEPHQNHSFEQSSNHNAQHKASTAKPSSMAIIRTKPDFIRTEPELLSKQPQPGEVKIDPERNEALEKQRPGDAVFKAIFGSDDEDDDDD